MSLNRNQLSDLLLNFEPEMSSGHYLDRMITLMQIMEMADREYLLRAFKVFLTKNHKPQGLDEFLHDCGMAALSYCKSLSCSWLDIKPLAWAVPYQCLKAYDVTDLRKDSTPEQASDMPK